MFKYIYFFFILHSTANSQNYLDYYKTTNKAENQILQENFDSASFFYKKAFKQNYGFGKDYYNAAICAVKTNKQKLSKRYIFELANKGLNINYLKQNIVLNSFFNDDKENEVKYMKKYDNFYTRNKIIRRKLDSLSEVDQLIRKRKNSYQNSDFYKKELRQVDSSNTKYLLQLIDELGHFPSENIIGLGDSISHSPSFDLLIWHQADRTKQSFNFANMLEKAVLNGNILPERASILMQLNDGSKNFQNDIVYKVIFSNDSLLLENQKKNNQWLYKEWILNKKGLNEFRYSIGLCSIGEYLNKVKYQLSKKQLFIFFSQITFPTYYISHFETANQLLNNGRMLLK